MVRERIQYREFLEMLHNCLPWVVLNLPEEKWLKNKVKSFPEKTPVDGEYIQEVTTNYL